MQKYIAMRFLSAPEGIRQAAGHGLFESLLLLPRKICKKQKGAVAQGKNPSAAAPLQLKASKSAKTLAIGPLIFKKQITQTGPSE